MSIITSSLKTNNKASLFSCILCLLLSLFLPFSALPDLSRAEEDRWSEPRRRMVERDLRARGIKEPRLLAAMETIPRHLFVPEKKRPAAYDDRPLPIGESQTISQPYIVALMTELMALKDGEKVLEIGTGSGYQTAVLARLAGEVYSIEILPRLSAGAKKILTQLGYINVQLKVGDGYYGWEEKGPFDAILLTAAAPKIPDPLWLQLREGGRLVMPLGEPGRTQRLVRVKKLHGEPLVEDVKGVAFVPLTGAIGREGR